MAVARASLVVDVTTLTVGAARMGLRKPGCKQERNCDDGFHSVFRKVKLYVTRRYPSGTFGFALVQCRNCPKAALGVLSHDAKWPSLRYPTPVIPAL